MQLLPQLSSGFVSLKEYNDVLFACLLLGNYQHSSHPILSWLLQHAWAVCTLLPILLSRKLRLGEVKVAKESGNVNQVSDPDSRDRHWNGWAALHGFLKSVNPFMMRTGMKFMARGLEWRRGDSNFPVTLTSVASFPPLLTPPCHLYEPHIRPPAPKFHSPHPFGIPPLS